jgi:hypothetical protein
MTSTKIAAAVLVAAIPFATVVATAGVDSASAATAPQAKISANVSDKTPASGTAFRVSGAFTENGKAAAGQVVKIQAQQKNGSWQVLTGAHQRTTTQGTYQLKVILNVKGARQLRAVGVGVGNEPHAFQKFTVSVH